MELLPPLFIQVLLTFILALMTGGSRFLVSVQGKVKGRDLSLRQPNWPVGVTKIGNAFQNQLETPILFYLLVVLLIITKQTDQLYLTLAWAYVAARLVHVAIHITINHVLMRFLLFTISMIILMVMWARFAMVII